MLQTMEMIVCWKLYFYKLNKSNTFLVSLRLKLRRHNWMIVIQGRMLINNFIFTLIEHGGNMRKINCKPLYHKEVFWYLNETSYSLHLENYFFKLT